MTGKVCINNQIVSNGVVKSGLCEVMSYTMFDQVILK